MFDIEKELIKLSIENLENFELDLTEPYILKKLDSYAKKYNLSYETPYRGYESKYEFLSDRYNYWNVIISNTNDLKDKIENLKYFKR